MNKPFINQRILSETSGYSLGKVNQTLKKLKSKGYVNDVFVPTASTHSELREKQPKNAIILAAGYGMRAIPINMEVPKGLITVYGEPLIERLITQLISAGITDITIVVGFMKEQYEYLTDKYNVKLVINMSYGEKNNLFSLSLVKEKLHNTYIVPCDIWCKNNPFSKNEWYSWYMVTESVENDSTIRVIRNKDLVKVKDFSGKNTMIGISYLLDKDCVEIREKLMVYSKNKKYENAFWEETLYGKEKRMIVSAKVVSSSDVFEINTYEQLRELDEHSKELKSKVIKIISDVFKCKIEHIRDINALKKGMTNRSFIFTYKNKRYIMRIPGEGTDKLIDRKNEHVVYQAISLLKICDDVVYINPESGYKITTFLEGARTCDSEDVVDVKACMKKLREFHKLRIQVAHRFDIFEQIDFYEKLWDTQKSCFRDYVKTKTNVMGLKEYIDAVPKEETLTHIDAVPDNFLFINNDDKNEIRLIDWEYSGMQDPHVDIAMFAIYSMYTRRQIDVLIDYYFDEGCSDAVRIKIYAYIAICGLLWSNWCEYKRQFGIEFGEYALRQYRYAKDYYCIFIEEYERNTRKRTG